MRSLKSIVASLLAVMVLPAAMVVAVGEASSPSPAKPQLSVERIPLFTNGADGKETPFKKGTIWRGSTGTSGLYHFRQVGEKVDAMWGEGAVLLMTRPGDVEVVHEEIAAVTDVAGCGKYIWIAMGYEDGLKILDLEGRLLAAVKANQGLPSGRHGIKLHPLDRGRMLVAGSFGEATQPHGWIATITFDGNKPTVKVFFEAAKEWDFRARGSWRNMDPEMGFTPEFFYEHVTYEPDVQRRIYLVGRRHNPLVIDPETMGVTVYPNTESKHVEFPLQFSWHVSYGNVNGELWRSSSGDPFTSFRLDARTGLFEWHHPRPLPREASRIASSDEWVYAAGPKWRRLNLRTREQEVLLEDEKKLPDYENTDRWTLHQSAHYGMVAFCSGALYRVRVTEPADAKAEKVEAEAPRDVGLRH